MGMDLRGASRSGQTVAQRNNNPGALVYTPANQWQGQIGFEEVAGADGKTRRFAKFDSYESGRRAQLKVIGTQVKRGNNTLLKLFSSYAPASDGNDPAAYARTVAGHAGIGLNDLIDHNDMAVLARIADGSQRVEGGGGVSRSSAPVSPAPRVMAEPKFSVGDLDGLKDQLGEVFKPRERLPNEHRTPKLDALKANKADVAALTGGKGIIAQQDRDLSLEGAEAEAAESQANAAHQAELDSYGTMDRLKAGFQNSSLGYAIYEAMDNDHPEADAGWGAKYLSRIDELEKTATSQEQVKERRTATSEADYLAIVKRQDDANKREVVVNSRGTGWGLVHNLAGGVLDPAGLVAGLGVGKAFQLAGVGGRALMAAGRPVAAIAAVGAEGAIGNVAVTAGLDMAGRYTTTQDYATAAAFGLAIGVAASPLSLRGGVDRSVSDLAASIRDAGARPAMELEAAARANLGEGATREAVNVEVARLDAKARRDTLETSLAPVPESRRLLGQAVDNDDADFAGWLTAPEEPAIAAKGDTPAVPPKMSAFTQDIYTRHNLRSISDDGERALVAEHIARAEALLKANPVDDSRIDTILAKGGFESTGLRLFNSPSPVAQAVAATLLESTTGAAGRFRTAAMSQATRERLYATHMARFDDAYHLYRKGEGRGLFSEYFDPKARDRFNSRVFYEVEARRYGRSTEDNQAVLKAADMWQAGMDRMRKEQQLAGTVGNLRLGDTSVGYMTHRIIPAKVLGLKPDQEKAIAKILSDQFVDPKNTPDIKLKAGEAGPQRGWDRKFADKFAIKYLELARTRALGGYDVPLNLHDSEAADIVMDTAKLLGLNKDDTAKLLGKFSRGGAAHTKSRLDLDLGTAVPDGKGGSMPLGDLFNQDIAGMYRGYARRVSGEVALAQYGIMGKAGLQGLRKSIEQTGGSVDDIKAFDQIAAEFLNTPFGANNHKYMDNLRIAASVSRLGGMGFTQLGEYTNAVAALGVQRSFEAIGGMRRLAKEVTQLAKGGEVANPILRDIDLLGGDIGMDDFQLTRMFDRPDHEIQVYSGEAVGIGTRTLRAAGHLQATLSGHRMITAVQTRGMAEQIIRKAITYAKAGTDDVALNDMGITQELRDAIRANMGTIAKFDDKGRLTELNLLDSGLKPDQIVAIRDAVERGASQIIQRTYTGETGRWAHDGLLKMLFQFRTFSVISVEKQWGRNHANYGGLKAAMYLMGAMSMALPVHLARTAVKMTGMSRSEREKFADRELTVGKLARATMNYASASGMVGDMLDIGGGFASSYISEDVANKVGARGQTQGQLLGGVLAPSIGIAEDAWDGIHGDGHKLVKLLPGANLPYVQPIINGIGDAPTSTR